MSNKSGYNITESPRRTVLNPFSKLDTGRKSCTGKPVQSTEEILGKVTVNPKTVKQRQQNIEALKAYNKNHEDDIFGGSVGYSNNILKPSSRTLLEEDSDSDSEQDISVHTARTPLAAYHKKSGVKSTTPMLKYTRTPGVLCPDSPLVSVAGFQAQAYIHKKVNQKTKDMRKLKKSKLASALAEVVSKTQSQKMVDESSQIINTVTNVSSASNADAEEEETDEWFEEEDNLSCDPGAGLMNMLSKHPTK